MATINNTGRTLIGAGLLACSLLAGTPAAAYELPAPTTSRDFQYNGRPPAALVQLGNLLFFDKILSGNMDIACSTCHHPTLGTGDGLALGVGTGGVGLGLNRDPGLARNRIVRNALPLWNLGWIGMHTLMIDGDIQIDATQPSGFKSPAGDLLPQGLPNIVAAQNMFPAAQPREMAGLMPSDSSVAEAAFAGDLVSVWNLYAERVQLVPEYVSMFQQAFPGEISQASDIQFKHIATALAAFQISAFRADNSPFDRYLRGTTSALTADQLAGMDLFYLTPEEGGAGCARCHSGVFQTDLGFHAISVPQIGPGRRTGVDGNDDGRFRNTQNTADRFKYRTLSLRNLAYSAPYGHDGAYATLEEMVRHHLDPVNSLLNEYDAGDPRREAIIPFLPFRAEWAEVDFVNHDNLTSRQARAAANELDPVSLTDTQISQLLDFLDALTDRRSNPRGSRMLSLIPASVPSGLPVED